MMKRSLPALLVSALIGAAPALAQPANIPAMRDGVPVQLRAEYVPASQFTAQPQEQAVDYAGAMLAAGYGPDGTPLSGEAAAYQQAQYVPQRPAPPVYQQPYDAPAGYGQADHGAYPPPLTMVQQAVPVAYPVPVAYAVPVGWRGNVWRGGGWNRGWNGGWGRGWNRGWGGRGWNGGWNRGWGGGGVVIQQGWGGGWNGYGRGFQRGAWGGGWGCRSTGAGALAGSVAGAALGYGVASPWDRGTGVVIGGLVGALAGTALERSSRCY